MNTFRYLRRIHPILVATFITLLTLVVFPGSTIAQPDGGPVESARQVWIGHHPQASVADIALRVAPILWFTPEEPHVLANHPTPSALPCDPDGSSAPVVYYRRVGSSSATLYPEDSLELAYYFYYLHDYGAGCHSNDLELATMHLVMHATRDGSPPYVVSLERIVGHAHGSRWYENVLDLRKPGTDDTSLPPTLLVEEGKHAVAPDRNGDGQYTPGYDVNTNVTDAWGVRDSFGSGYLGNTYAAHMTKRRHDRDRWMADAQGRSSQLWSRSHRSAWFALPTRTYILRRMPLACLVAHVEVRDRDPNPGCGSMRLTQLLEEKDLRSRGKLSSFWHDKLRPNGVQFAIGLPAAHTGAVYGIALWNPDMIDLPRGWISFKSVITLAGADKGNSNYADSTRSPHDFPWVDLIFHYTPSLSWPIAWYAGGGLAGGFPRTNGVAVAEAGLQFRWHPRFVGAVGVRYDQWRKIVPVVEVGLGGR
ncbi:MAG: hypothetical protein OXH09_04405 [Gammaproteobacteria bacterium]|nr:hypothetical protein [Gammaproteobacteria bacterium]